jgi:hypothetical protein
MTDFQTPSYRSIGLVRVSGLSQSEVRQCLRICVYAQASTLGWRSALACVIETPGPRGDDVTIRMVARG